MLDLLNALIPVFLLIALGHGLKRIGFPDATSWTGIDRINYFVLFPALLIKTLAVADINFTEAGPLAIAMLGTVLTLVVGLVVLHRAIGLHGPRYASVFQGTVRWNGFVALAAVTALYGIDGAAWVAVVIAVLVPVINVMSVVVLTRNAGKDPLGPLALIKLLSRNPLIIACLTGIVLNLSGVGLPGPSFLVADLLGRAALTLGLLSVGAGLILDAALRERTIVLVVSLVKLVVTPLIAAGWCLMTGVEGLAFTVAIFCAAVPGATSSYVLARQLGGDAELMASLITGSTVLAMVTMPLMIWLLT